jgi:uncharacterized protein
MQFIREDANEAHAIVACAEGEVRLRERAYTASFIVTRTRIIDRWQPGDAEALTIADFSEIIDLKPELLLLGTGSRQRIPPPALYAGFAARRIGLEVMDNRAACRTFNLLLSEYRDVAVALML